MRCSRCEAVASDIADQPEQFGGFRRGKYPLNLHSPILPCAAGTFVPSSWGDAVACRAIGRPAPSRYAVAVFSCVLRRSRIRHRTRRFAGQCHQRASRLHRFSRRALPPVAPGGMHGRRLAASVSGRPAADVQGASGCTDRWRNGARRADAASRRHRTGARRDRVVPSRCGRIRGRRRHRHVGCARDRSRSTSSPATATCSSWSTTRSRCGSSIPLVASGKPNSSTRLRSPRSTASRAALTPISPFCVEIRATACLASQGIGDKTAAALVSRFGSLASIVSALESDSDAGFPAGTRTKLRASSPTSSRRAWWWRPGPTCPSVNSTTRCRRRSATRRALLDLIQRYGLASPAARLLDGAEHQPGCRASARQAHPIDE